MMEAEIESAKHIYDVLNEELKSQREKFEVILTNKNELNFKLEEENKTLIQKNEVLTEKLQAFYTALQDVKSDE